MDTPRRLNRLDTDPRPDGTYSHVDPDDTEQNPSVDEHHKRQELRQLAEIAQACFSHGNDNFYSIALPRIRIDYERVHRKSYFDHLAQLLEGRTFVVSGYKWKVENCKASHLESRRVPCVLIRRPLSLDFRVLDNKPGWVALHEVLAALYPQMV